MPGAATSATSEAIWPYSPSMWQVLQAELSARMLPQATMLAVLKFASDMQPDHSAVSLAVNAAGESSPVVGGGVVPPARAASSAFSHAEILLVASAVYGATPWFPPVADSFRKIGAPAGVQSPTSAWYPEAVTYPSAA